MWLPTYLLYLLQSNSLPAPIINIRLQFSANHVRNAMLQPDLPE